MKIIDAHTHIDYISSKYQTDVIGCCCCARNESEWDKLLCIINNDTNVYGAFGIHPWFISDIKDDFDKRLCDVLKMNSFFMVGEIGLDKYKPNMKKQIYVFIKQLDIAVKLQRTVFLHCVGAWDKIFHVLKQYKKYELPLIVAHDFHGSKDIIDRLISNYNVMFSFSKIDKEQDFIRIKEIDINKILVETDAKSDVVLENIVDKISLIKDNVNADEIIYSNTKRVLQNG